MLALPVPPPVWAADAPDEDLEPPHANTALDITDLPSYVGLVFVQTRFANDDRLRAVLLDIVYNFGGDYLTALVPILDFVPGEPDEIHATGLGDMRFDYIHAFQGRLFERVQHAIGLTLQVDSATAPQFGAGTTVLEPLYAFSAPITPDIQFVLVARYLRDIGAGFATPIQDTVLLAPLAILAGPNDSYGLLRFNNFLDLKAPPNTFTGELAVGRIFADHYNLSLFYEFPLNETSRQLNVETRFGMSLLYQF